MTDQKQTWKKDEDATYCDNCSKEFTFFRRRHHCRKCGFIFCSQCCSEKVKGVVGYESPQKICVKCRDSALHMNTETVKTSNRQRRRQICILGQAFVGKTAIFKQFMDSTFPELYSNSVQNTRAREMSIGGVEYSVTVMDTEGQNNVDLFQPQFLIGTHGILLVYDITDRNSFTAITVIREKIMECGGHNVAMILVGNKLDLSTEQRQVQANEAKALAQQWRIPFVELSAKKKQSVEHIFTALLQSIIERKVLQMSENISFFALADQLKYLTPAQSKANAAKTQPAEKVKKSIFDQAAPTEDTNMEPVARTKPRTVAELKGSLPFQLPSLNNKDHVLKYIEDHENSLMITVSVCRHSIVSHFSDVKKSEARKYDEFQLRIPAQCSINVLIGLFLRKWLAMRHLAGLSASPASNSLYDDLVQVFADVHIAIADPTGSPILPLKRLVKNKRQAAIVLPSQLQIDDALTNDETLLEIEREANAQLLQVAQADQLLFSQKSILSILQTKSFRPDGERAGVPCILPPYRFCLYISQPVLHQRQLLQCETKRRFLLEGEGLMYLCRGFATQYFQLLQKDAEFRIKFIIQQSIARHDIHGQYVQHKIIKEQESVIHVEKEKRSELELERREDVYAVLGIEKERVQFIASAMYHRRHFFLRVEEQSWSVMVNIFEKSRLNLELKENLEGKLVEHWDWCTELEFSAAKEMLQLLHLSVKRQFA